jgi:hypothetical protein
MVNYENESPERPGGDPLNGVKEPSIAKSEEARLQEALRQHMAELHQPTQQLHLSDLSQVLGMAQSAFGVRPGVASLYTLLPASMAEEDIPLSTPLWRIELHDLQSGKGPLGLDIVGDVVVGRAGGDTQVDLDLEPYNASQCGVSRRHAMLRPTANGLFVLDLGSTNGTMINAMPVGPGMTRALAHDDTLSFGTLSCIVKIISSPVLRAGGPEADARPE